MSTPEAQYAKLAETHLQNPRVSTGRMLKSEALRVANKSYAYLSEDGLVVKLPEPTVTGLVEQGSGAGPGHRRPRHAGMGRHSAIRSRQVGRADGRGAGLCGGMTPHPNPRPLNQRAVPLGQM